MDPGPLVLNGGDCNFIPAASAKRKRSYAAPAPVGTAALTGDMLAGAVFGVMLSSVPVVIGTIVLGVSIADPLDPVLAIGPGALRFSAL